MQFWKRSVPERLLISYLCLTAARTDRSARILREAKKYDTIINYVDKERLDGLSETKKHQGVSPWLRHMKYAEVEDILAGSEAKGEPPFTSVR